MTVRGFSTWMFLSPLFMGVVAEWLNAPFVDKGVSEVMESAIRTRKSWVRIPPTPLFKGYNMVLIILILAGLYLITEILVGG